MRVKLHSGIVSSMVMDMDMDMDMDIHQLDKIMMHC